MRTKDWKAINNAKVLVVGEDSNLQWSESVPEYVMFADYYFRGFPEDHGERSRNVEARNLFNYITKLTGNQMTPEDFYITNLCNDNLEPAPKGKRVFIPEDKALKGIEHIEWFYHRIPPSNMCLPCRCKPITGFRKADSTKAVPSFYQLPNPGAQEPKTISPFTNR